MEHEVMQQITMSYFCLIIPNLFKEILHIIRIQAPNMIHTIMAFAPSLRLQSLEFENAKIFIIKCFDPTLQITKLCCKAVPDDRFGVLNNPTRKLVFSLSSREEGKGRKGTTKFSCSYLAVDISRCRASCCAEQPYYGCRTFLLNWWWPVTTSLKERSGSAIQSKKKKGCIGRKQESINKSGAWTYILCLVKHKFCVLSDFIQAGAKGRHVTRCRQVLFICVLVLQSRKQVAEPHPCSRKEFCHWDTQDTKLKLKLCF